MKIAPKKSLGQNFLVNPGVIDKIVAAAEINSNDTVLEIGPGTGILTEKIAKKAGTTLAIEKDHRLIADLQEKFKNNSGVKIIEGDILRLTTYDLGLTDKNYKIVANIPYYITSHLLRTIFEKWPKPEMIILTIQKEVARRIVSKPPDMNLLALSVQYYAEPKIVGYISKNSFRPVPKVDSAIIKLTLKDTPYDKEGDIKLFELMKAGFSEKRKQLAGNLSKILKLPKEDVIAVLEENGIDGKTRAENLSLAQWGKLLKALFS